MFAIDPLLPIGRRFSMLGQIQPFRFLGRRDTHGQNIIGEHEQQIGATKGEHAHDK